MDIMSAQLHTMTTTTTTQQQYVKATTPPPPNLPRVDESLYRFFPPTERTKGRPIEGLNAQIACLCSSSTAVLTNNADNIGNRHRRLIENIFHSSQENKITLSDDGAKCVHSPTGHDSVLAGVPQVLCNGEDDDNDEDDAGRSEDLGDRRPQLLFLVRHGQTDMNAAGRLQGRGVNAPLNAAGRQQGDELGEFLHSVPFGTVMSSSLDRAHEVCAVPIAPSGKTACVLGGERGRSSFVPQFVPVVLRIYCVSCTGWISGRNQSGSVHVYNSRYQQRNFECLLSCTAACREFVL